MTKEFLELNDKELDAVSGGVSYIVPSPLFSESKVTVQETCPSCGYLFKEYQKDEIGDILQRLEKCPGCGEMVTPKVTVID